MVISRYKSLVIKVIEKVIGFAVIKRSSDADIGPDTRLGMKQT